MLFAYMGDGESMNECVDRLISETEAPRKIDGEHKNIHLNEATLNKLAECKAYDTESYTGILYRLLIQVRQK